MAVGTRFEDDFYIVPPDHVYYAEKIAVRVTRKGKERKDIVTELLKYLRYRYELSERALYHHAKVAVDAMIGKVLEMWRDAVWAEEAQRRHPSLSVVDSADLDGLAAALKKLRHGKPSVINDAVQAELDLQFTTWSDDGLLEHLRQLAQERGAKDRRWRAIGELVDAVLDRQLFKAVGWADGPDARAVADDLYARYRAPDARRRLERNAAYYAGLDRRFHVVLWVPNPDMKLKVADVLVDAYGQIMPLSEYKHSGEEIIKNHRDLWGVGVYTPESVRTDDRQSDALLGFLSKRMGVTFRCHDGRQAMQPDELAIARVANARRMNDDERSNLATLVPAAKGAETTFAALEATVEAVAAANKLGRQPRTRKR
ncbi:MAG: hypothetical protein ACLQK4_10025 [Acidimicrobiales bacterium]